MSTIAEVTQDRPPAAAPDAVAPQPAALSTARAAERRSLLVPVLSTACAALIAGVLTMAVVGFNTLRDDIRTEIGSVRGEIGSVRGEIGSVRGEIGMLRNDMHTEIGMLRDDMHTEIGMLDAKIDTQIGMLRDDMRTEIGMLRYDMNARFGEVNAILLDHTERLARIETTQSVKSPPAQQP